MKKECNNWVFCLLFIILLSICSSSAWGADRGLIKSGETKIGIPIANAGEVDTWYFDGTQNDRVLINAETTSGNLNTYICLIFDGQASCETATSGDRIDWQLKHTGQYYIQIRDDNLVDTGTYNLTFLYIPDGPLSYSGDLDGGPIVSGQTLNGTINVLSDMDAFQFNGTQFDRVLINAETTSGNLDTVICLYPEDGGLAEAGCTSADRVDYQLKKTGLYTIVIMDYGEDHTGTYNLTFLYIPDGPLSYSGDPDGGPIVSGQTLSGTINVLSDMDAFQFNGNVNDRVLINAETTSGNLDTVICLYPEDGGLAEAGCTSADRVDYQLKKTGLYTIVIMDYGEDHTGTYNLTFLKIPCTVSYVGDLDGGPIVSGQTLSGTIDVQSDMDAYKFYGQLGEQVTISAVTTFGTLNTVMCLYPPDGSAAEIGCTSADNITNYTLKKTGLYTIVIMDYGEDHTGTYNVYLSKIPTGYCGINNMSPQDGTTVSNPSGSLCWNMSVSGCSATGYDVYFGEITEPFEMRYNSITSTCAPLPLMEPGKSYHWYVVAHTISGDVQSPHNWFTYPGVNYYCDKDQDNYKSELPDGTGTPPPGCQSTPGTDCNDNDNTIYPLAPEICDNKDNDCDGQIDEGCPGCRIVSSPDDLSGNTGEIANIPVNVDNANGIAGFEVTITESAPAVLACTTATSGTCSAGCIVQYNPGTGKVAGFCNPQLQGGSCSLAKLVCQVMGTEGQCTDLPITSAKLVDLAANEICSTTDNGRFCVGQCILGDMNQDKVVDISDVIRVLRCSLGLPIDPYLCMPRGDINCDDVIDISDVILTLRKALGIDPQEFCSKCI